MAGENITILHAPGTQVRAIRPVAPAAVAAGDVAIVGLAAGFWLHDVKAGEVGEFCIEAGLVSVPNDAKAHKAGELVDVTLEGITFVKKPKNAEKDAPGPIGVVFSDAARSDDRVLVAWGYK